jgi:hypothetical protein
VKSYWEELVHLYYATKLYKEINFWFSYTQSSRKESECHKKTKINDEKATRDYGAKADQDFIKLSKAQMKEATYSIEMKWKKAHA